MIKRQLKLLGLIAIIFLFLQRSGDAWNEPVTGESWLRPRSNLDRAEGDAFVLSDDIRRRLTAALHEVSVKPLWAGNPTAPLMEMASSLHTEEERLIVAKYLLEWAIDKSKRCGVSHKNINYIVMVCVWIPEYVESFAHVIADAIASDEFNSRYRETVFEAIGNITSIVSREDVFTRFHNALNRHVSPDLLAMRLVAPLGLTDPGERIAINGERSLHLSGYRLDKYNFYWLYEDRESGEKPVGYVYVYPISQLGHRPDATGIYIRSFETKPGGIGTTVVRWISRHIAHPHEKIVWIGDVDVSVVALFAHCYAHRIFSCVCVSTFEHAMPISVLTPAMFDDQQAWVPVSSVEAYALWSAEHASSGHTMIMGIVSPELEPDNVVDV